MKKLVFGIALLLLAVGGAFGQSGVRASVSVVGEARMSIAPDQVVFTFEVVTVDKNLIAAKRANDTDTVRTLETARSFQIAAADIQTDSLTIAPKYTDNKDSRGEHVLIGYEVTKRIMVKLRDLEKLDAFLAKVIEAGVNRVVGISIENSEIQKYQEQVRALAVKNARSKAESYARQLGQSVGKAYVIREENADQPGYSGGSGSGNGVGGGDDWGDPSGVFAATTFALGQIKIEETIYVTFDLN